MIITIKGANFADSNIGTLSTWNISRVLGNGATYSGSTYVDKGAALNATVTIAEGYELGTAGVTVTMGGSAVTEGVTVNGNTITITIASVTGNIVIKVPTINTSTGEEDEGGTGSGNSGNTGDGNDDNNSSYLSDIATLNDNMQTSATSATLTSSTSYFTFTDVPVTAGGTYRIAYARRIWEFDSSGSTVKTFAAHKDVADYTFTVSDNTVTISVCIAKDDVADPATVVLEIIGEDGEVGDNGNEGGNEGGDTNLTVRVVAETGAVLTENSALSETASTPEARGDYYTYEYIPVESNTTYKLEFGRRLWQFDSQKATVGSSMAIHNLDPKYEFTTSENVAYISITVKNTDIAPENLTIKTIG